MKLMNFLILLLLLLSSEVYAEYLMLDPIHRVVNIEDQAVNLTVLPQIEITTSRERLDVNLLLDLDLSDLTNKLTAVILKDATLSARCGKRLTSQLDFLPNGPSLSAKLSFHFELWNCLITKVPEVHGGRLRMVEREVWRTRVLQQNAHICIDLQPKFTNATMDFSSTVTCFGMDGIAGGILDSIPDKEATKVLLGKLISYAIGTNLLLNTPDNLKQYNPKITDIKFRNVNGKIYMLISGSFSSSPDQITNIISGAKR